MTSESKIRVLVAKLGLDGHDVGARVVARGLMEAGMEVVYTGVRRRPEQVAAAARDEDCDVIGVSSLSGAHVPLVTRLAQLLRDEGLGDVLLIVGGIVPDQDLEELRRAGVAEVFHPGTALAEIVSYITANHRGAAAASGADSEVRTRAAEDDAGSGAT